MKNTVWLLINSLTHLLQCMSDICEFQVPEGEDVASFERHNRCLKLEYKKKKPLMETVGQLMRLSFAMRRNDIMSSSKPISVILSDYPFLGNKIEASASFD